MFLTLLHTVNFMLSPLPLPKSPPPLFQPKSGECQNGMLCPPTCLANFFWGLKMHFCSFTKIPIVQRFFIQKNSGMLSPPPYFLARFRPMSKVCSKSPPPPFLARKVLRGRGLSMNLTVHIDIIQSWVSICIYDILHFWFFMHVQVYICSIYTKSVHIKYTK